MLVDFSFFFYCFIFLFIINWNLDNVLYKKILITIFSIFIIYIYNPYIVLLISLCSIFSYLVILLSKFKKNENFHYLIFLLILLPEVLSDVKLHNYLNISIRNPINVNFAAIGISYLAIKIFLSVRQKVNLNLLEIFYLSFFIPTYVQGPIHSINNISKFTKINFNCIAHGSYRIALGFFKIFLLTQILNSTISEFVLNFNLNELNIENFSKLNVIQIFALVIINFLILYINFSGFVDISIGLSLLIGIVIPENFNNPLKSKDISEFWSRWHMTLANFVKNYIYFPILIKSKSSHFSIFFAFLIVGIWHKINIGYLIWGVGHGLLLAFNKKIFVFKKFHHIGNRILTLLLVSILSFVANYYKLFV